MNPSLYKMLKHGEKCKFSNVTLAKVIQFNNHVNLHIGESGTSEGLTFFFIIHPFVLPAVGVMCHVLAECDVIIWKRSTGCVAAHLLCFPLAVMSVRCMAQFVGREASYR